MLNEFNFCQLVKEETHEQHGTLDLVMTNSSSVNLIENLKVCCENEICSSDHFGITFGLNFTPIKQDPFIRETLSIQGEALSGSKLFK